MSNANADIALAAQNGVYYVDNPADPMMNMANYMSVIQDGQQIAQEQEAAPVSNAATQNSSNVYGSLIPSAQILDQFDPTSYQDYGSVPYVSPATVTAAQMGGYNPAQAATMGGYQQAQAATVDPSTLPGALSSYEQQLQTALNPSFQQQDQQLQAQLQSSGILDSSAAAQATGNLQGQQAAALSSGIEPMISQFAGYQQQDETQNAGNQQAANLQNAEASYGAAGTNTANQQAANMANATSSYNTALNNANFQQNAGQLNQSALNQGNEYNSTLYNGVVSGNEADQNAYLAELAQMQNTQDTGLLASYLGSYDPNNTAAAGMFGAGLNNASSAYTNAYNAGAGNTAAYTSALGNLGQQFGQSLTAPKDSGSYDFSNTPIVNNPDSTSGYVAEDQLQ